MSKIHILGLGAGTLGQMPLAVYQVLKEASPLLLRTKEHPVVAQLEREGIAYTSYDHVYTEQEHFEAVYEQIVVQLEAELAQYDEIYYAVPGHPSVAEKTVQLLLERSTQKGYTVEIVGGQSFLDPLFATLAIDPVEGFLLLDGTALRVHQLQPSLQTVITQVYDPRIASEVKLTLMEVYPDEYPITVATAVGVAGQETIEQLPLYELDRRTQLSNLTCVYLSSTEEEQIINRQYFQTREIVRKLRGPEGCPWDREQTHHSLKKYLLEETEEVVAAIEHEDVENLIEELGDLLFQIFLHAQIAQEEGYFALEDVFQSLNEKMIRRHPHVFGDLKLETPEEVRQLWAKIKQKERE